MVTISNDNQSVTPVEVRIPPEVEKVLATSNEFLYAYIECMIWADKPEDSEAYELSASATKAAIADCVAFQTKYARALLAAYSTEIPLTCPLTRNYDRDSETGEILTKLYSPDQAGHDFWLQRNGHGAGFADRGLSEWVTITLSGGCGSRTPFPPLNLYENDNGTLDTERA